jgi:CheY-like chemotaxis protein
MKVLIVDDDLATRIILESVIQRDIKGCEIVIANDGVEFLERIEKQNFDLIITDINMPNLDGLSASNIMHVIMEKTSPIIAITAMRQNELKYKELKGVFLKIFTKPFRLADLIFEVRKIERLSIGYQYSI